MEVLEIGWFAVLIGAAICFGLLSEDGTNIGWMLSSMAASVFALFFSANIIAEIYSWWTIILPSPTSSLNPTTAAVLTALMSFLFIWFIACVPTELLRWIANAKQKSLGQ